MSFECDDLRFTFFVVSLFTLVRVDGDIIVVHRREDIVSVRDQPQLPKIHVGGHGLRKGPLQQLFRVFVRELAETCYDSRGRGDWQQVFFAQ